MTSPPAPAARGASVRHLLAFWEIVAALLLGFAEATFFFLLPETLITFVAMQKGRLRAALVLALVATVGALLGGWLLYSWGAGASAKVVTAFLDALPGISREMVGEAFNALHLRGAGALFAAPFADPPYKVLAAVSAQAGIPAGSFLLASAATLLLRFISAALVGYSLAAVWRLVVPKLSPAWIWAAAWLGIYGLWFTSFPD